MLQRGSTLRFGVYSKFLEHYAQQGDVKSEWVGGILYLHFILWNNLLQVTTDQESQSYNYTYIHVHLWCFVSPVSADMLSELEAMKKAEFTPSIVEYLNMMLCYAVQGELVSHTEHWKLYNS